LIGQLVLPRENSLLDFPSFWAILSSHGNPKQQTISRSSLEVEYRAMIVTTCEIQWLIYLLQDFRVPYVQPAILYCDNQLVIQIANNLVFHERTKHIEIDWYIIREKVAIGLLKLLPISSSMQVVDIFTKSLPLNTFTLIHSKLGMKNIYYQLEGSTLPYWNRDRVY